MIFLDKCYKLFESTSKYFDLSKDVENYNKANAYLYNFNETDRKEIEKFIIEVRSDNPIYFAICQIIKTLNNSMPCKLLENLTLNELRAELQGEVNNLILKGAYDSILLLNNLDEAHRSELAKQIASSDMKIFDEYKSLI